MAKVHIVIRYGPHGKMSIERVFGADKELDAMRLAASETVLAVETHDVVSAGAQAEPAA